jgi:exopolysaccharide production protein ExoZ
VPKNGKQPLIHNIQLLRFVAALSVVFLHSTDESGLRLPVSFGGFGVDIFFVISGFIISTITFHNASHFWVKRLIRIVPFYWTATLAIFFLALAIPSLLHHAKADVTWLVFSLFFIPHDSPHGVHPLLGLGWTLNYEMYFYAVFAVTLFVSRRWAAYLSAAVIIAVLAITRFVAPASPAEAFYGDPIVLEFIWGIVVFELFRRVPWMTTPSPRGAGYVAVLAILALALLWLPIQEVYRIDPLRLSAGAAAAIVVAMFLMLEKRYGIAAQNRFVLLVGEASYVLYLIHPYVVFGILRLVLHTSRQLPLWSGWLLAAPLLIAATGAAIAIHLWFEVPVMNWLRRKLIGEPRPAIFEPADA